ncbi:ABC transporter permease [Telmatobacter sp. DSM 110680]|uniref:ABC transporter permease n=1 Tax=Telmatobacter sp. DSM 110680 TaxID=3036704 RepID=A0AAU7DR25_9BACT
MFKRKRSAEDFAEEIKAHLELEADDLRGEGLSEEESQRRARVEFGSQVAAQESFHRRGRWQALDNLARDLRFSLRSLLKSPGFAFTAILTVALGVGANTAVFSVMNAVLLKSLPVADPQTLVYLRTSDQPRGTGTVDTNETMSYPVYDTLRKQTSAFSSLIAYVPLSGSKVAVRVGSQPEEAEGDMVSGAFFSGLGVNLPLGRGFTAEDEANHAPLSVISYNYWTRRFARSPGVLGQTLFVNGVPTTIIGVSAQGFEGLEPGGSTDFWIPLQNRRELNAWGNPLDDGKLYIENPKWWCLRLIARLAPGVSKTQAIAQLQAVFRSASRIGLGSPMQGEKPLTLSFTDAKNFPGYDQMYGNPLRILMAMVGLVLLIALANVAMLLAARNAARQREFSVRQALGAGRGELFRQLLTESLILVTAGGALAWAFAMMAARLLANWAQIESSLAPDRTVLLFTMGVLVVAAVLFGLAPMRVALAGRAELAIRTSAATSNTNAGKSRTGKIIVALQMAMCVVLLVGAGLLIRTLRNLENTPLGMRVDGLVVFGVNPDIPSLAAGRTFYRDLISKLRILPGVESVTVMEERLGSGWSDNSAMMVDGRLPDVPNGGDRTVRSNVAGPDFFTTLGIPVLEGRDFADSDTVNSPPVGIINEEFAKRFLAGQNPLGHHIGTDDGRYTMTVIGVVKDHKYRSIDETPIPMAWYMSAQIPMVGPMSVEMRVKGAPLAILPTAQKVVQQLDPNLPLIKPMTQRDQFNTTISSQLMFARLAEFFGLLAVVLVATGLYGTLSYRVNRRTAEIGVRMAMGAGRGQVVWMILRDSLTLTAIGIVAGIPLAMFVGRALMSSLYGVKPLDSVTYMLAVVGVTLVALLASAVPASRAASVDPLRALRTD